MTRPLLLAPLLLAACGGGDLSLSITSDDLGDNTRGFNHPADLTTVKSLRVTVDEIWVHVAAPSAPEVVQGEDVPDGAEGWHLLTAEDQSFDLMTVRAGATRPLGDFPVPAGKLTQVRLKLKPDGAQAEAQAHLAGAVVEQDGTTCDLSLPSSACEPGLKVSGSITAMPVEAGGRYRALLNLRIKDSTKLHGDTCGYKLDPVLKVRWLLPMSAVGGN